MYVKGLCQIVPIQISQIPRKAADSSPILEILRDVSGDSLTLSGKL
jgi:hypothetical protein